MATIMLRDTQTGEEATVRLDGPWDADAEFLWEEGNYACDCNRGLFFARALGRPEPLAGDCGESRYEIARVSG